VASTPSGTPAAIHAPGPNTNGTCLPDERTVFPLLANNALTPVSFSIMAN
jgi:hypothetical protein